MHGHGHGNRVDLEEPLLRDATLSDEAMVELSKLERWKVRMHMILLVICGTLDLGLLVAFNSESDLSGPFDLSSFDMTTKITEIVYMVVARGCCFLGLVSLAILGTSMLDKMVMISYWTTFSLFVYGIGKLIAFNWSNDLDVKIYVGLFSWLAFGVAEMVLLTRLEYWLQEQGRWVEKEDGVKVKQESTEDAKKDKLSSKSLFKVLKPYFWPRGLMNKIRCALTWVFLGISKATNLMSPIYIGNAVEELSSATPSANKAIKHIVIYSVLVLISKVTKEMQNVVYLKVKQTAYVEIAEETFTHLHSLSLEWHLKKRMGNVLRSMDRGVNAANTLVTYLFLYLLPSIAECVVVFIIFYTHFDIPTVSATAFMSFVAYGTVTVQITLWRKKFREQTNKHDNDYHDKATDSLINYETVKYFTAERYEIDRYTDSIYKFQRYSVNTQYSLSLLNSTQNLIIQLCTAICLCIAAHEVASGSGKLKVGQFVSISAYIAGLFAPLSFLGSVYNAVIQALVDMSNLSELLAEEPDLVDEPNARPLIPVPTGMSGATIEFRNVVFHYPQQLARDGLKGISFTIPPGTTTAICGSTGAGKSTISRLLFRFYDPLSGKVLISNQDIKYVTQYSLRRAIGVVPQDTVLFNDTLRHNIAYGKLGATQEEIEKACASAQILDFIKSLPEGFETKVGERGLKLSGGERQRIAICRCLLKNPPIVVLDEATSALDTKTERSVQQALDTLTHGQVARTTLVIAHRLTTIRNANQIVVLEKGEIMERGTHSELLDLKKTYYSLWNSHLEEQREEEQKIKELTEKE